MEIVDSIKRVFSSVALDQQRQDMINLAIGNIELLAQRVEILESENARLKGELHRRPAGKASFPNCPFCGEAAWALEKSVRDKLMGDVGACRNTYTCRACGRSKELLETK